MGARLNPFLAILLVCAALAGLLFGATAVARALHWQPESARKLVHIGMGLVTLGFPWVFSERWPVLVLCLMAMAGLFCVKVVPALRIGPGEALHGVARVSLGEFWFTLGVAIVFWIADGNIILYCVPILILTVADAAGALAGIRYGKTPFATLSGTKSIEGCVAFLLVAFFAAHVPLLLLSDIGRAESLLAAAILATMVMLVEAITTRGLDNLLVPVGACLLLQQYLTMAPAVLAGRLFVIAALLALVLLLRKESTLDGGGLTGGVMLAFGCWSLGGFPFLIPFLVLFAKHVSVTRRVRAVSASPHNLLAVFSITGSCLPWAIAERFGQDLRFLAPFLLALAAHLAILGGTTLSVTHPKLGKGARIARASLGGGLLVYIFELLAVPPSAILLAHAGLALVLLPLGCVLFERLVDIRPDPPGDARRWWIEGALALAISAVAFLLPAL
jgi:phytol kinase